MRYGCDGDGGGRSGNNICGDTATTSLDQPTNQPTASTKTGKTKQNNQPTNQHNQPTQSASTAVKSPASDQRRRQRRAATRVEGDDDGVAATAPSAGQWRHSAATATTAAACDTDAMATAVAGAATPDVVTQRRRVSTNQPTNQQHRLKLWQNKTKQPTHKLSGFKRFQARSDTNHNQ